MPPLDLDATGRPRSALIIAPFWGDHAHVGGYRVDRFIRWLRSVDVEVTVVNAAARARRALTDWGTELSVADPLRAVSMPHQRPGGQSARLVQLRRIVVNAVSPPDGRLRWARRVAADAEVRDIASHSTWIVSTSPPESSHLAAAALARGTRARLVIDMRDGWLDEPLKWLLQHSRVQRWREGRMERRVLTAADKVFVVSDVLAEMLAARLPEVARKSAVLTNSGPPPTLAGVVSAPPTSPPTAPLTAPTGAPSPTRLTLLYAGRFTGSNRRQKPGVLFDALERALAARPRLQGRIRLVGAYEREDLRAFERTRAALSTRAWSVENEPPIARESALCAMADADGLLLLAMGHGVLTTKLFEYLSTGRPILAVTVDGGALWRLGANLPQLFVIAADAGRRDDAAGLAFLDAVAEGRRFEPPAAFSEAALRETFLRHIGALPGEAAGVYARERP